MSCSISCPRTPAPSGSRSGSCAPEDMCLDCGIYAGLDLRKTCFVVEVGGQAFEVKAADGTVAARTRGELPL